MASLTQEDAALLAQPLPPLQRVEVVSDLYPGGRGFIEFRAAGENFGSGRPVVLCLHGIGSSADGYRAQLAGLAGPVGSADLEGDCRVIVWNAPGFGNSTPLAAEWPDAALYVEALAAFAGALGLRRIDALVGSSWGSVVATTFAAHGLLPVGTLLLSAPNTARGALQGEARKAAYATTMEAGAASFGAERATIAARLLAPDTPRAVAALVERLRDAVTLAGWRQAAHMLFTVDTPSLIARVPCPIDLLAGSVDRLAPLELHATALHAACLRARLQVFEGCGHMLKLEAPGRFNALVRQALAASVADSVVDVATDVAAGPA